MAQYVESSQLILPDGGHILIAEPGAQMFDITKFVFGDDTKHNGWTWIGDVSAESPITVSEEGGEQEVKGTWDRRNARTTTKPSTTKGEINVVGIRKDIFTKLFNATAGATNKSLKFDKAVPLVKQLLIIAEDGSLITAMRYSKVSLIASLPEFKGGDYLGYKIKFTVLDPHAGDKAYELFDPQALTASA